MSLNKIGVRLDANTSVSTLATTFHGKSSGRDFLRFKDGVLYTKPWSKTRFLAALGNKAAQATIRSQSAAAQAQLALLIDKKHGAGTAGRIGLTTSAAVTGHGLADLDLHAAAAQALHKLGVHADATVATRDGALQTIKSFMAQAMADQPGLGIPQAAQRGAFRYALTERINEHALRTGVPAPKDLRTGFNAFFKTTALSPDMSDLARLDAATLEHAAAAYEDVKAIDAEKTNAHRQLNRFNALADDPEAWNAAFKAELSNELSNIKSQGTIFRSNTAFLAFNKMRPSPPEMDRFVSGFIADLFDAELTQQLLDLSNDPEQKNAPTYKLKVAGLVEPKLRALLGSLSSLPDAYRRELALVMDTIEQAPLNTEGADFTREDVKRTWLVNDLVLRKLNPAIIAHAIPELDPAEATKLRTAMSLGFQKLVNGATSQEAAASPDAARVVDGFKADFLQAAFGAVSSAQG